MLMCFAAASHAVYTLPPDKLAKAIALSHAQVLAHFGGVVWRLLVLWLLIRSGAGAWLRDRAARIIHRRWLQGFLIAPAWLLIVSLIELPIALLMERVYHTYGISIEPWTMWFGDYAKSLGLTLIVGTFAIAALYGLMRWSPRRWWLWFWVLAIPCEAVAVFVVPIIIDPLFDHFSPLAARDPALVRQLERVAQRGHLDISPNRIFVMDASTKVTAPNAYVTGFGASKRIVVWDTTLNLESNDEILAMYGHEQGHYVLHHIYLGMLFSFAAMLVFFWIASQLLQWTVRKFGSAWHIPAIDDWSSVGVVLLLMTILGFFAEPVGNAFSRWEEHAADVYGQEVLHGLVVDPQATCVDSFQKLGELWLDDPQPNAFVVFWTYSHPSIAERVRFAASYDPWSPGHTPKYVRQ